MSAATHTACYFADRVDATPDALVAVRDALSEALVATGWSDEEAFRVLVCADEAMANALTHGETQDAPIDVRFRVTRDDAHIVVRDRHAACCVLPSCVETPDETAEHGRGLILMAALADRFRIRPSRRGTSVGLFFHASGCAS